MVSDPNNHPDIHFKRITAKTVREICRLSDTLPAQQRKMVARNGDSIAQAHFSENAWFRAIYADETPIGFLMLQDYEDGSECPGVYLWRLMIAYPYQGKGYGKEAMENLFEHLTAQGVPELYTSCSLGEGSPEGFYRKLGFEPTGGMYGEEIELVCKIDAVDNGR